MALNNASPASTGAAMRLGADPKSTSVAVISRLAGAAGMGCASSHHISGHSRPKYADTSHEPTAAKTHPTQCNVSGSSLKLPGCSGVRSVTRASRRCASMRCTGDFIFSLHKGRSPQSRATARASVGARRLRFPCRCRCDWLGSCYLPWGGLYITKKTAAKL